MHRFPRVKYNTNHRNNKMYQYRYFQYVCGYEPKTEQCIVIECSEPKPYTFHAGNRYQCICRHLLGNDQYYPEFERCPGCCGKLPDNSQYTEKISEGTGSKMGCEEYKEKEDIDVIALPNSASITRDTEDEWEDDISLRTSYRVLSSQTEKKLKHLQQRAWVSFPTCGGTRIEDTIDVPVLYGYEDNHGNGRLSPDLMFELELDYPDPESTAYFSKEMNINESVCHSLESNREPCTQLCQKPWQCSDLASIYTSAYFGGALYKYQSPSASATVLPPFITGVQTA
ncbi:hypothetical protein DFP73DRAFT_558198 [Morchella snyderi]|nr:hypothetical protein DFP73DRAFT_558198 [Morchella snyderi]